MAVALLLGLASPAPAAPPPGVYQGVTAEGRPISVTVNESNQISSYHLSSVCFTVTVHTSCPISNDSFSCGGSVSCIPNGAPQINITGTFDPSYQMVQGTLSLAIQGIPNPIPPFCCSQPTLLWVAEPASSIFRDGFEGDLLPWTFQPAVGPYLEFSVFNRFWAPGGTDSLKVLLDGGEALRIQEGQLKFFDGYRRVRLGLVPHAGTNLDIRFEATSFADGTRADFYLDDVAVGCPAAVPNPVNDPSFEAGTPNPSWVEESTNFPTPLCDASCNPDGARTGSWFSWFGGVDGGVENGALTQLAVPIPVCP